MIVMRFDRCVFLLASLVLASCNADAEPENSVAQGLGSVYLPASGFGAEGVTTTTPPATFPAPGGGATAWPAGSVAWCCSTWFMPLDAAAGEVVASVTAKVQDNGGAGGNGVVVQLVAQSSNGTTALGSWASSSSGAVQTASILLATPFSVPAGTALVIKAVPVGACNPSCAATKPSVIGPITITNQSGIDHVVSIPLFAPFLSGAQLARSLSTFGQDGQSGIQAMVSGVPVGSTITAITARMSDTALSQCALAVADQHDAFIGVLVPASSFSSGAGLQTLSIATSITTQSLHTYWISLIANDSRDPCNLFTLEASYR